MTDVFVTISRQKLNRNIKTFHYCKNKSKYNIYMNSIIDFIAIGLSYTNIVMQFSFVQDFVGHITCYNLVYNPHKMVTLNLTHLLYHFHQSN